MGGEKAHEAGGQGTRQDKTRGREITQEVRYALWERGQSGGRG